MENSSKMKRSQHGQSQGGIKSKSIPTFKIIVQRPIQSANEQREKRDDYRYVSRRSLFQDIKNTTLNRLTKARQKLNSFSTLLKPVKYDNGENYHQITNQATPIKLYSPFGIETPPIILKNEDKLRLRKQLFTSPNNKLKDDIKDLGIGINHLHLLEEKIPDRYRMAVLSDNVENIQTDYSKRYIFHNESLI